MTCLVEKYSDCCLSAQDPGNKQGDHSHTIGVGTKLYMSPEQKCNSKYRNKPKVDIYALGLIFFEMNCPTGSYQERDEVSNKEICGCMQMIM